MLISSIFKIIRNIVSDKPWTLIIIIYLIYFIATLFSRLLVFRSEISIEVYEAINFYEGCKESEKLKGSRQCNEAKLLSEKWSIFNAIEKVGIEFPDLFINELNPAYFLWSHPSLLISAIFFFVKWLYDRSSYSVKGIYKGYKEKKRLEEIMRMQRYTEGFRAPHADCLSKRLKNESEDFYN